MHVVPTGVASYLCLPQDILPQPMSGVQSIFGFLLGNVRPGNQDTVVSVKRTVLAIAWLAINQSVGYTILVPGITDRFCSWSPPRRSCDSVPLVSGMVPIWQS